MSVQCSEPDAVQAEDCPDTGRCEYCCWDPETGALELKGCQNVTKDACDALGEDTPLQNCESTFDPDNVCPMSLDDFECPEGAREGSCEYCCWDKATGEETVKGCLEGVTADDCAEIGTDTATEECSSDFAEDQDCPASLDDFECPCEEGVDSCVRGITLLDCSWVDEHNASMAELAALDDVIDVNEFRRYCRGRYEETYSAVSTTKFALAVSSSSINATKLLKGWENKPLLKSCRGRVPAGCPEGGQFVSKLVVNGRSVVDCAGKGIAVLGAVTFLVGELSAMHDGGCLIEVNYRHPVYDVVEATSCETDCNESSEHECNVCGATEPDRTTKEIKTVDLQSTSVPDFAHQRFDRGACNADWESRSACTSRGISITPVGWCMSAVCGTSTRSYYWITPEDTGAIIPTVVAAYQLARAFECIDWSREYCSALPAGEIAP
jgi:hypothetical protein